MAPSEIYPTWSQRQVGDHRTYLEQESPSWVVISEASRPPRSFEPCSEDRMDHEYQFGSSRFDGPVRMFDGPVGPSPEEDKNAPFYVPRSRMPPSAYHPDFRGFPGAPQPQYIPPFRDDDEDHWRATTQVNEYHHSYTDNDRDQRNPYRAPPHLPHDRKTSTFPYPKQSLQRDRSRERHAPPPPRTRRQNGNAPGRHRRRASSINRRQSSRETSVSNTSQHSRQYSHDESATVHPLPRPDLSPQSNYSYEQGLPSPKSLPLSPISTPSIAGRSWNGTTPPRMEDTNIPQAISILNQMLQRQSLDQILHHWKITGLGPNPYEFPQWEGWFRDPLPPRP